MTGGIPALAERVLRDGVLCHLAVRTHPGPGGVHLTPAVYVLDGGRLWMTTARRSVKARAWRRDASVAGLVRGEGADVSFRGRVRTYDALDPLTWPPAAQAGPRILRAAARFSLKNARFFAGYAIDARRVPLAWTPPGRVFVQIRMEAGRILLPDGSLGVSWGDWPSGVDHPTTFRRPTARSDLHREIPADVRRAVGSSGRGTMALGHPDALTVLPVSWHDHGVYEATASQDFLAMARFDTDGPAALTVDRLSAWRASEMTGILLIGTARAYSPSRVVRGASALREASRRVAPAGGVGPALVRIRPVRAVWWRGWASGTVDRRRIGRST